MSKMKWPAKPGEPDFDKASLGNGLTRPWSGPDDQKRKAEKLNQEKLEREKRSEERDRDRMNMKLMETIWDKKDKGIPLSWWGKRIMSEHNKSK
jgi:hypothetical protein